MYTNVLCLLYFPLIICIVLSSLIALFPNAVFMCKLTIVYWSTWREKKRLLFWHSDWRVADRTTKCACVLRSAEELWKSRCDSPVLLTLFLFYRYRHRSKEKPILVVNCCASCEFVVRVICDVHTNIPANFSKNLGVRFCQGWSKLCRARSHTSWWLRYQRIGINLMLYPAFWWFVGRPKAVDRGSLLEMDNIGYILWSRHSWRSTPRKFWIK